MAAVKRGGLGKGLDALITTNTSTATKKNSSALKTEKPEVIEKIVEVEKVVEVEVEKVVEVEVEKLVEVEKIVEIEKPVELKVKIGEVEPNREQPRKNFDEDSLIELADSIKQFGVLQPILVKKKDNYYEIVAGERRWRAAKLAGLKEVPIVVKDFSDLEVVEIALIENIQRENLNPIEEALAYKRLMGEFHMKQDEIAERVSKSRTAVTNSIRLLKLNENVQQMVIEDMISTGHARALLTIEDKEQQYALAMRVFDEKLSVRETEALVKSVMNPKPEVKKEKKEEQLNVVYQQLEEKIKSIVGTKVAIHHKNNNKGKIEIEYYSQAELERLIELFESMK